MNVQIHPTELAEVSAIADILQQANALKQAHGDDIWGNYPFTPDEVTDMIQDGGFYTATVNQAIAGCVKVTQEDERIWGHDGLDGNALYIHRLATANAYRGKGLGGKIIDLVGTRALSMKKEYLRLDCETANTQLCEYYLGQGFSVVRSIEVAGRAGKPIYHPSLFQRTV